MPTFEVEYFEPDGIPHMVTISPVLALGELENFDEMAFVVDVAAAIIDRVIRRVQAYNGWSRARCGARITGILNATNHADNKTWDIFQHLIQITPGTILYVLERLAQSEVAVEVFNLDWTFTIDINSLMEGAGGTFPIPSWYTFYIY